MFFVRDNYIARMDRSLRMVLKLWSLDCSDTRLCLSVNSRNGNVIAMSYKTGMVTEREPDHGVVVHRVNLRAYPLAGTNLSTSAVVYDHADFPDDWPNW